jgi:class 3 adenylate cyclase
MSFVKEFSANSAFPIRMRMGLHTGTVAAGILGKKKFSYDLWGDVVNVASRFESSSSPDKIHVSEAVRVRLSDDFVFSDGGTVELKRPFNREVQQTGYAAFRKTSLGVL